ncbi:MAG: hypothetical protein ABW153_00605 [Sedimenticola sp.]
MPYSKEIFGASFVINGDFNPPIFTPDWLEQNGLIGAADAEMARADGNLSITRQIARYDTEWFELQVLENQFSMSTKGAVTPSIKDLIMSVFTLLPQTPVSAFGLNFMAHYKMDTRDEYHKVGDMLAPKGIWNRIFGTGEDTSAGLETLTMKIEPFSRDQVPNSRDVTRVTLQPSNRVKPGGIYFSINNHYEVPDLESAAERNAKMVEIINSQWEEAWANATDVFEAILDDTLGDTDSTS